MHEIELPAFLKLLPLFNECNCFEQGEPNGRRGLNKYFLYSVIYGNSGEEALFKDICGAVGVIEYDGLKERFIVPELFFPFSLQDGTIRIR